MFQFAAVKFRSGVETVPSAELELRNVRFTSPDGRLLSATEIVAAPPPSVVSRPEVGVTTNPGVAGELPPPGEEPPPFGSPLSAGETPHPKSCSAAKSSSVKGF